MMIKELTEGERPRERMLEHGPAGLSDGELLAILLRSGTKGESALDLARRLLTEAGGSLVTLSRMPLERIRSIKGLGGWKAFPVLAAIEMGRRFMQEEVKLDRMAVIAPVQIYRMMKPLMKGLLTEECWIIFLNGAKYVIHKERVSAGGLNSTVFDIRLIVSQALERKAASIAVVHNHPSGNPRPGTEDIKQTNLLRQALRPFSITLLDHVVMCDDCYYSFADEMLYHES